MNNLPEAIYVHRETYNATPLLFPVVCAPKGMCVKYVRADTRPENHLKYLEEHHLESETVIGMVHLALLQGRNEDAFKYIQNGILKIDAVKKLYAGVE
jgi:hypothetical protein